MLELNDENFETEVLKKQEPALVDFWRPGCRACLTMDSVIEEVSREFKNKAIVGKLNVAENLETAKLYKIPAVPTLIIFKDGKPVEKAVGLRSKEILVNKLNSLIGRK